MQIHYTLIFSYVTVCKCAICNMFCYDTEILAADKQLAEEIQFDLKRVEEEQKKAARAAHTPLAATPHAQMVRYSH